MTNELSISHGRYYIKERQMKYLEQIFKYELPVIASIKQEKPVPVQVVSGSSFLSIGVQRNKAVFWCRHETCDEKLPMQHMIFLIVMTAQPYTTIPDWYITFNFEGTLLLENGDFVIHVFRKKF